jgi:hypothetical protein
MQQRRDSRRARVDVDRFRPVITEAVQVYVSGLQACFNHLALAEFFVEFQETIRGCHAIMAAMLEESTKDVFMRVAAKYGDRMEVLADMMREMRVWFPKARLCIDIGEPGVQPVDILVEDGDVVRPI